MRFEVLAEDRLTREVPSLLRAIVNGRDWLDRILTWQALNQLDLAKQIGVGECYVGRIISLAFLAPEIVEQSWQQANPKAGAQRLSSVNFRPIGKHSVTI
jgi:hypothetical protein